MGGRGEDVLVGAACLLLALALLRRILMGLREGAMPVYRTRLSRTEGGPKFAALIAANALVMVLLIVIAADLLLGLGLRGR